MNTLQKYEKYLYLILLLGVVIYFPIFFNGFVWDDYAFILSNPQVHQFTIPILFGPSIFNSGAFYRPLPAVYFAFIYSLAGNHAFLYHLVQLSLHLVDSFLLFLFFCVFFSDNFAFFLALIFLVHPINVESVAFIGSTQSELYFLPGIIALLLSQKQSVSRKRWFWITGLLLVSVLTKETGFLFLILVIVYRYLFKLGKLKEFVISGISIIVVYGLLRFLVGGVALQEFDFVPIATLTFSQRLLNIPDIIFYYFKTFFFPTTLTIWQSWIVTTLTFQNFVFPFIISAFLIAISIYFIYFLSTKKNTPPLPQKHQKQNNFLQNKIIDSKAFIFFTFWFVMGMGLILQIVPLDMTVADRWFYFPIVGLLGMLGVVLQVFAPSIRQNYKIFFYAAIVIISLLSLRTFIRTFDWKNELTIYADAQHANDNYMLDHAYAIDLFNSGKQDEAITYVKQSIAIFPTITNGYLLGDFYKTLNQPNDAIPAFQQALSYYKSVSETNSQELILRQDDDLRKTYIGLSYEYDITNNPNEAINLITNKALLKFPSDPDLYINLSVAYTETGEHNKALAAISKAYALRSDQYTTSIYTKIKNNIPLFTNTQ